MRALLGGILMAVGLLIVFVGGVCAFLRPTDGAIMSLSVLTIALGGALFVGGFSVIRGSRDR